METFGQRLRKLRNEKALTGDQFGKVMNVTKVAVSKWETDDRFPDKELLVKMADYFDVTLDYLLGRTDNRNHFIAEHIINGHSIKVMASKEDFPDGFSDKDAAEYMEIARAIQTLGLTNDELNFLLRARELGIQIDDLNLLNKLKELGLTFDPKKQN